MIASENSLIRPRHADVSRTPSVHPRSCCCRLNVSKRLPNQICQLHVEPYDLEVEHSFFLWEVLFNIPSPRRVVRAHDATKRIERGLHDSHHVPSLVFLSLSFPVARRGSCSLMVSIQVGTLSKDSFGRLSQNLPIQLFLCMEEDCIFQTPTFRRLYNAQNGTIFSSATVTWHIRMSLKKNQAENVSEPHNVSSELNGATKHCLCK